MFVKNELKERRMRVDVVLLMKNSASMLGESIFEKRIKSIKCNIPVNNLSVVDAFSSDGTIDIIKRVSLTLSFLNHLLKDAKHKK